MKLVSLDAARLTLKNRSVNKPNLAETIRTARAKQRLTRKAFAAHAGITTNTLRALENGTHARLPDVLTLQKVAEALELSVDQLLAGESQPQEQAGLHKEDWRIARAYHDSIADVKAAVKALLTGDHQEDALEQIAAVLQHLLRLDPQLRADVVAMTTIAATDAPGMALLHDWMREKLQPAQETPQPRRNLKRRRGTE
jgi:transcriptional regulator with XRE-family HTH domain